MGKTLRIGSRESILAVAQSRMVMDYLAASHPEIEARLVTMKTTGDVILDRTLDQVGGKGLFVKELDLALRDGRVDITVHSLKDMPMEIAGDIPLVAFSRREDPRDVLVLPEGAKGLDPEKPIGSSSPRRMLQLKELFPGMEVASVRGNVQTRLRKLDEGQYSALVLAGAGLKRLGLAGRISRVFTPDEIIPAAGQGIVAVEGRAGEDHAYLEGFHDREAHLAAICERACVRRLNGGCSSPIAAYARPEQGRMVLRALYVDVRTGCWRRERMEGAADSPEECEKLGIRLAEQLLA